MGAMLSQPVDCKVVEQFGNKHYKVSTCAMNGFREAMEDAHVVDCMDNYGYFAVFDGHSGSLCSKFAAETFHNKVQASQPPLTDQRLSDICLEVDKEFLAQGESSGCTATMMVVSPENGRYKCQVANVGDSRVIAFTGGKLVELTEDHKPENEAEKARIEKYGGHVANNRTDGELAMSRAIGDGTYKKGPGGQLEQKVIPQPDIAHVEVGPGDWVLLYCDGIVESNFENDQVAEWTQERLAAGATSQEIVMGLCDEALTRGSKDNMTAVFLQFTDGTDHKLAEKVFVPGPFATKAGKARIAYRDAVVGEGFTLGFCLAKRHEQLQEKMMKRLQELKEQGMVPQGGVDAEIKAIRDELENYKHAGMPKFSKDAPAAEKAAWYERLGELLCGEPSEEPNMMEDVLRMMARNQAAAADKGEDGEPGAGPQVHLTNKAGGKPAPKKRARGKAKK